MSEGFKTQERAKYRRSCFSQTHTWVSLSWSVQSSLYTPGEMFRFGHLNTKIHNTLSNQNRLQCCISKDNSCRGQAVRNLSSISECDPYRSRDKQVDNCAHQKKTAQNICTIFLLNDTSEARTIAVACSKDNERLPYLSILTSYSCLSC